MYYATMARKPEKSQSPVFFGHVMSPHLGGHRCRYALTEAHGGMWSAFTLVPLPYYEEVRGRTEKEAIRMLERSIVREFKSVAKIIGYEVHDG